MCSDMAVLANNTYKVMYKVENSRQTKKRKSYRGGWSAVGASGVL